MKRALWRVVLIGSLGLVSFPVSAHVSFVRRQIPRADTIDATLRVPHGCKGSPTLRVRMRLPRTVLTVTPRAGAGWSVESSGEGGAREIIWSGRLSDRQTGEFAFAFTLAPNAKAGDVLFFPVVQECEVGVERWIDMKGKPSADSSGSEPHDEATSPAPSIRLLPGK
ncbi:MAG: DUF1775 domain-containing protein [Beijerinckiaceae bacterium]|jgi:periplasmic copper chaperone A|nr:DUF1775 domain-containing protein [Beijerinckiaceae bacterium]